MLNLIRFTTKITTTLLIFGILSYNNLLLAGGFYIQELGTPSSIGTAGTARTTNREGAETAFGNPAGMTGLKKTTLIGGSQVLIPNIKFDSDIATAGGSDGGNAGNPAIIPSLYFVKPLSESAAYGFSIVAPLGGGVDYGDNFVGRYTAQKAELQGVSINNSFGYKVNDKFSVGAGVSLLYTLFEMDLAINQPGALPDGQVRIEDADDWAPQLFLSMNYELSDKTLLGVVYRSEADIDLSGDIKIKNTILPFTPSGTAKIGWDNPQLLEIGIRHHFNEKFAMVAQADWEDWSEFSYNSFEVSLGVLNTVAALDRNFKDTWRLGVGMAYTPNDETTLLFGTSYDSSPVSDSDRTFDLPFDEQIRLTGAYIHEPEDGLTYGLSASFVYFGDGKIDQTSQGVRAKGEFDTNWGLFIGGNIRKVF